MPEEPCFEALMGRLRAGDQAAAAELLRRYEGAVRRVVRLRLRNARLRSLLDSTDVCQSVFASFFAGAAAGQYELETPEQLVKLLVCMARNKVASQARKERAQRRDSRRHDALGDVGELAAAGPGPEQQVAAQELLDEAYRRLSPDERRLVELRNQGRAWAAIAAELEGTPVVLRKRLSRALERVARALGLNDTGPE
jgi:RNA polymerase sigma-70 factor (ECF subfamily)